MQSMPYYQQGYQTNTSYSNNGSPVPSSVLSTAAPPMMTHANGMSPHPQLGEAAPATQSQQPPKRKQVKNACTNCQKACKKCDDARPCPRCIKYGIAETCVNSVRKERKKGIKRGPYKRRQKEEDTSTTSSLLDSHQPPQPGQPAHQSSPYMRPPSMAFGYPSNLNQYGQPTAYDPYGSYAAAYHKDQMMPQSYVVNPMYQSMGYPVLMPGAAESQQQQQPQQPSSQQPPQQQQHASYAQHSPVPQPHYSLLHQQQSSRQFGDHMLHQQQQQQQQTQGASSPAHLYYQQQHHQQQHQPSTPQPSSQQHTPQQQQRHLPDIKELQDGFMKPQPMTPVPSASTSSGTSTPPESTEDEDGSKYARLSQLCTAALHHNSNTPNTTTSDQQNSHAGSPNPQQQS
ncbi:hypothetical protein BDA99DRAFT_545458 [Phascolomyces articulosus]|uniref:Zn(2)-C6 fungal-type domain-containing protein n=1 Tax=Phascolomyces articulosus TaxID=60185 RepID=A0AAD5KKG5_9FUNG|nr:hypothetical protein BDA99DRAFT_545458 [Phascolomyces articulosus]